MSEPYFAGYRHLESHFCRLIHSVTTFTLIWRVIAIPTSYILSPVAGCLFRAGHIRDVVSLNRAILAPRTMWILSYDKLIWTWNWSTLVFLTAHKICRTSSMLLSGVEMESCTLQIHTNVQSNFQKCGCLNYIR